MIDIKFGTPVPVVFYDNILADIEMELHARFVGRSIISDYDINRYGNEEELSKFLKSNCIDIAKVCFEEKWPAGISIVRTWKHHLGPLFYEELARLGIIAKTEIVNFTLTEESEKEYKEKIYYFTKPHLTSLYDDHINTNIIPPDIVKSPISMPWFPDNVNNHTSPATPPVSGPAWDCPACGSKDNHYSFCPECGTKRPEISEELKPGEWRCICGYVTSSKFCPECGRAKM